MSGVHRTSSSPLVFTYLKKRAPCELTNDGPRRHRQLPGRQRAQAGSRAAEPPSEAREPLTPTSTLRTLDVDDVAAPVRAREGGTAGTPRWRRSIDHIHDVLSAILRTAMKWGHLRENPARGVDLPKLRCVRPKWALTTSHAAMLLGGLASLPRTMFGLALLAGLRRGELFALRWRDIDEQSRLLTVREAVYDGVFATPKTEAGARQIPLSDTAATLMAQWKAYVGKGEPDTLVLSTKAGTPILPNNVLRRFIFPACTRLGLPRTTWLTFRRTYSSWSHDRGVPANVVAQLMGHANVDTTLNVYTQVLDGSLREAVQKVGSELFTIVHKRAAAPLEGKGQRSKVKRQRRGSSRNSLRGNGHLCPLTFDCPS